MMRRYHISDDGDIAVCRKLFTVCHEKHIEASSSAEASNTYELEKLKQVAIQGKSLQRSQQQTYPHLKTELTHLSSLDLTAVDSITPAREAFLSCDGEDINYHKRTKNELFLKNLNHNLDRAEKYLFRKVKLFPPENLFLMSLGFKEIAVSPNVKLMMKSYECSYGYELNISNRIRTNIMEVFLTVKNTAVAYMEFYYDSEFHRSDTIRMPPLIGGVEVREEFRGKSIGNLLKLIVDEFLIETLHSNGEYSREGADRLARSPLWKRNPEGSSFSIYEAEHVFVDDWTVLRSRNVSSSF